MRVRFSIVGRVEPYYVADLDMPMVPREGETVTLPDLEDDLQSVRTVVWYPLGDPDDPDDDGPLVYIVVGPRRPEYQ